MPNVYHCLQMKMPVSNLINPVLVYIKKAIIDYVRILHLYKNILV